MDERLRALRKELKITQSQLAEAIDVTQAYVAALENGRKKNPTKEVLDRLAKVLNTTVGYLVGEEVAS